MMNGTDVSEAVLERLAGELEALTPEARKAAAYVLENPNDVGVSSVREIAEAAKVSPNTVVRMARQVGFEGYEDFRAPFRDAIRAGAVSFPDRARWLQSLGADGLYGDMVASALRNIEETFAGIDAGDLKAAAQEIWACRKVFVLGVGVHNANARNFAYLAGTGLNDITAIPQPGSTALDDLARADRRDVLIAMTCKPYRAEIIDAVQVAKAQGLTVIGISDSPASPLILGADHRFVVSVDTPQFFPSSVSVLAVLETLLSFVIAAASGEIVERVEAFHARRRTAGLYVEEGG